MNTVRLDLADDKLERLYELLLEMQVEVPEGQEERVLSVMVSLAVLTGVFGAAVVQPDELDEFSGRVLPNVFKQAYRGSPMRLKDDDENPRH